MLWIPSEVWFSFLSRRLQILNEVHETIYRRQPPNYGVLSGLFSNLMQSVMFTPPVVNTYVRESLAALQYKRNCDRFGMFFLDNLDLENSSCIIEGIQQKDDEKVKSILGPLTRKPRFARVRRRDDEDDDEDEQDHDFGRYPIGPKPTWNEITSSIESDPTILIPRWEGLPKELEDYSETERGSIKYWAGSVFVRFTEHLWIALNGEWRVSPKFRISPDNVQEALRTWTVDFLLEHCGDPLFRACAITGLQHVSGRHVPSFGERRITYFPSSLDETTKFWKFFSQEPGYLHFYWQTIEGMIPENVLELQNCLEKLLEHCQCLPDSSPDRVWHVERKRMVILTNPKHYRIQEVGQQGRKGKKQLRSAPAHRSGRETQIMMLEAQGYPRKAATSAVNAMRGIKRGEKRQDVRSKRAKNKRVPPKARNQKERTQESIGGEKTRGDTENTDEDRSTDTTDNNYTTDNDDGTD